MFVFKHYMFLLTTKYLQQFKETKKRKHRYCTAKAVEKKGKFKVTENKGTFPKLY